MHLAYQGLIAMTTLYHCVVLNWKTSISAYLRKLHKRIERRYTKCVLLKHTPQSFPRPPFIINCVHRQTTNTEESKVVYVEISSERADNCDFQIVNYIVIVNSLRMTKE